MSAFDKEETMTDMSFVNLLEKDVAVRQAKMGIWYTTNSMQGYNESMFYWKKEYRGRYSEKYLERSGFEPVSPGVAANIDDALLLSYVQGRDPAANALSSYNAGVPDAETVGRRFLHYNAYDWTNHTNTLVYGGVTYTGYSAIFNSDESIVHATFTGPNNTTFNLDMINEFASTPSLYVKFGVTGQPPEFYRIYIEASTTVPWDSIGTVSDITMSAIVPIKEDDEFTAETLELRRMLNKFGLGGGDLIDSLTEDEDGNPSAVDNAYVMEGLPFSTQDDPLASYDVKNSLAMALYRSFEYLSADNSKNFSIAKLNMTYAFDVTIETISGTPPNVTITNKQDIEVEEPLKVGDYCAVQPGATEDAQGDYDDGTGDYNPIGVIPGVGSSDATYELYFRETESTYKKMVISNYSQTFTISGISFTAYIDSPDDEGRLLIPLDVLNDLKFRNFVPVHERSFTLLAYAIETYTIKWYQRGIFKFIFTVLVTYFTGGAGTAFTTVLLNAAINFAIAYALTLVVGMIDNEFLALVVTIAASVLLANGSFDLTDLTFDNFLPMANKVVNSASTVYADYVKTQMKKIAEEAEEQKEEDDALLATMKPGLEVTRAMMDAHFAYLDVNGPSSWINQMLGNNLYNFDQYFNAEAEIQLRKQVASG